MAVTLETNLPAFANDISDVIKMMLANGSDGMLAHTHTESGGWWVERCAYGGQSFEWRVLPPKRGGMTREAFALYEKRLMKRAAKQCCYYLLKNVTGRVPPWGALTGIRPTRLYAERLAAGDPDPERALIQRYDVRPDKAALLGSVARAQVPYLDAPPDAVDIYVGIPYCATRCAYCSFKTEIIPKDPRKTDAYVDALEREIHCVRRMISEAGLRPRALYVGGGTPTALDAARLDRVLSALDDSFCHEPGLMEYTVEAGRPDTLDNARLAVLRSHPVTRVSINPQTMNDATLALIGRMHTAAQTEDAFARARQAGFDNVNMDLIAALPGETEEDFARTLEAVRALSPESLTIHTLALKRASRLSEDSAYAAAEPSVVESMIAMGNEAARSMGMSPYYLYRQKQMAGDMENVGYAKPGRVCVYNIDMMEETVSILALGAGGISKRVSRDPRKGLRIERAANMMESHRYIVRVEEMALRKRGLWGMDGEPSSLLSPNAQL
ncbi:MAG: coproporphyrinogen dehydrogenase HemZ [Oscillospiraceae bacterium]|jgi:oxygen-independent coproporphyrinogen-3 oxidase|nr:coproporphyrinogen dehydrogenase HemZ [Oscillospiraceae bacterium]